MNLETRLLGTIEYQPEDIVTFPAGLPGFENEHQFLFFPIEGGDGMFSLQSIATPHLCFIAMDPFMLDPSYAPVLSPDECKALQVDKELDLCFYVLCALKKPVENSTVNLKCPIAYNPDTQTAYQVFLDTEAYAMHHPLSEFSHSEEDGAC